MTIVDYDWDEVQDNIVEEYDEAGATVAGYTTERGLYGNVISQRRDGKDSYFHYDGQGSTLALSDGDVTDTYAYSAFGELISHTGSTVNPFQHAGQKEYYKDSETGEYYVRRRSLAPIGRWLSRDPLSLDGISRYLYSRARPQIYYDPSGLVQIPVMPGPIPIPSMDPHDKKVKTTARCRTPDEQKRVDPPLPNPAIQDKLNKTCQTFIDKVWESDKVRKCRDILKLSASETSKCDKIQPHCKCCGKTWTAYYSGTDHTMVVCSDRFDKGGISEDDYAKTLCHELLHARQSTHCRPENNPYITGDDCANSLKKELQAYYCATGCDWT